MADSAGFPDGNQQVQVPGGHLIWHSGSWITRNLTMGDV